MTNTCYDDDYEITNCSENNITLATSDDLNFSKYWTNPRIDVEVLRGKKLREQKLKSHPVTHEYDVVEIDFDKPSCSTKRFRRKSKSRSAKHHTKKKRHKSPIMACNRSKLSRPARSQCPMRIAELAVPTKRHCIETWRNKHETLPSFMVERLRQIIMDEKPIIKIHDAINSFKTRKPSTKSRSEKIHYPNVREKNLDQIKLLCGIFGYKMTRKLLSPLNIKLNPHLKKISQIVHDEITFILPKRLQLRQEINRYFQVEIADKVTIWIANILEEASYRLLLEDFQELEEEEGVVWDLLDDLVDSVVIISEPESLPSSSESTSISETEALSDLPIEIPIKQNNEPSLEENMEVEQPTMVHSILMNIVEKVVQDENITTESKSPSKENETSEISDISNNIRDNDIFEIINEDRSKNTDISLVKDAYIQELPVDENKSELRNKYHSYSAIEQKSTDIQDTTKEIETFNSNYIQLAKDTDKISTTSLEYELNINEIADKNEHNQSSDIMMIDIDIDNTVNELKDIAADNIEQIKNKDHNISIILPENTFLADELVLANKQNQNDAKDIKINIEVDDTVDNNSYIEVANNKDEFVEISTDSILTKADRIDVKIEDNVDDNAAGGLEANDHTPDDSIKKVKFSDINIGIKEENELSKRSNNPITKGIKGYKLFESDTTKTSKELSIQSNIYFAPPNDNLLTEADEPWPGNLALPMVKVTLSVSKSVLSLGKITETEEKYMISPDENDDNISITNYKEAAMNFLDQQLQNVSNLLCANENKVIDHVESFLGSEHSTQAEWKSKDHTVKYDPTPLSEHPSDIFKENNVITKTETFTDTMYFNDMINNYPTIFSEQPSVILEEKHIKEKNSMRDPMFISKMTTVNLPFINITPKTFKNKPFTNEKIVQTDKTAIKNLLKFCPVAEVSKGCCYPEYKNTHKNNTGEYQMNKTAVRKWCQGLENVVNNLELWSSWVENTCTYIMFLKHNEFNSRKIKPDSQQWLKLQTDVKLDAALWFKISSDLQTGMNRYRNYYESIAEVRMAETKNKCFYNPCSEIYHDKLMPEISYPGNSLPGLTQVPKYTFQVKVKCA